MDYAEMESYIHDYGEDLYCFCRSLARNSEEAEDLYQETFLKLYEMAEKLEIRSNPKGCLMAVSVNLYRNYKRKAAIRRRITGGTPQPAEELPFPKSDPACQALEAEEVRLLRCAVDELEDRYRQPVLLYYMEELQLEEIAGILKVPKGTVKSRLYRAKKILKRKLEDMHYERSYE